MLQTGIYVRVSTEEQAQEGYSIRAQEQKLKDYAKIKEWNVYKIYADEGISGKNIIDRPAINEMLTDIKSGKVGNVLVFKIDRLTRNTVDLIYLVNLFNEHNCEFNSLCESIDTQTPAGRMFIKIIGIFAEFERENIVERTKVGFERKVREGYTLATRVPSYGYDRRSGEKIQTINQREAVVVREVFNMFINQHLSFLEIAKILNERGIPTKENAVWHARTVKNMLTNCNYIGRVRYATKDAKRHFETEGAHEPIISIEQYEEVQELIKKISVKCYTKRPKEEHYFSGVLFCAKCGGRLVTHGSYRRDKDGKPKTDCDYRCGNYIKKTCSAGNVSHKNVEIAFREYINAVADFDIPDDLQTEEKQKAQKQISDRIERLTSQFKALEKKEKEILTLYISNSIDFDHYMEIKKTLEQEKANVSSQIQSFKDTNDISREDTIRREDIIKSLRENWDFLSDEERQQFLIKFVDKIIVESQKQPNGRNHVRIVDVQFAKM